MDTGITHGRALALAGLIATTEGGIASRILAKNGAGNVTLFAFDAGQGLSEHTTPYEAMVLILDGSMTITIAGDAIVAGPGTIVRLPASVPHALDATIESRMLLIMLREPKAG
jgi:quercetin dioxygenase-like cupin family protein